MARTTIKLHTVEGFDVRRVIATFSQIVADYGYEEKVIKGEPCWSKGDGVIAKQQNFGFVIGQGEILLQAWMNDVITGESDLEGIVAVVPKKKMKGILEELENQIAPIASVRAEGTLPGRSFQNGSYTSEIQKKEESVNKEIEKKQEELEKIFARIGKQYFEHNQENPDERFLANMDLAKECGKQIEILRMKKKELREENTICPVCGKTVVKGQVFCGNCGAKVQDQQRVENQSKFCAKCGSAVVIGSNFCGACGNKVV